MNVRLLYFVTLILAGFGAVMGGAHVLELAPKSHYPAPLYKDVTSTLYRYYGLVGGTAQVLALVWAALLCWRARRTAQFRWVLSGAICFALSLGLWAGLVQPVNAAWDDVLRTGLPDEIVKSYSELRFRWEWGHVAAFVPWMLGFTVLVFGAVFRPFPGDASGRD